VAGAPVTSGTAPATNSIWTATASCPAGKVALGGGGLVTTTVANKARVGLHGSYPSAVSSWTAVGVVTGGLGGSGTITVQAWVLCSL
jgi:hypothetical protein